MLNFDLESNGLLDTITNIHCMSIGQVETEIITRYRPEEVERSVDRLYDALERGEMISGHNIINYDIPAISKIFPKFYVDRNKRHLVLDTLVLARLIYSNISDLDAPLLRSGKLPAKLYKSHSLRAYGHRFDCLKGDFAMHTEEDEDKWAVFNEEMLDYNEQDVVVDTVLLKKLEAKGYSQEAITLEHEVAWLIAQQTRNGVHFNVEKAKELEMVLQSRLALCETKLLQEVPPIPDKVFVPKRSNKTLGYEKGVPIQRYKDFNANSRDQIKWITNVHFGYYPDDLDCYTISKEARKAYTEDQLLEDCLKGKYNMSVNDVTFEFIAKDPLCPEAFKPLAKLFEEYLMVSKRLGQLSTGKTAWLSMVTPEGKIHGSVNPNGAVTGRATHSYPNMSQVPATKSEYGHECRELFEPPKGWYQVGIDASGLELRCLAHFMFPYDGGAYAEAVVNGNNADGTDVHTLNQKSAGLATRDQAKTFIYGFLKFGTSRSNPSRKSCELRETLEQSILSQAQFTSRKAVILLAKYKTVRRNEDGKLIYTYDANTNKQYRRGSCISHKLQQSKRNAKAKGLEYDLTLEFMRDLWAKQEGLCALSGRPLGNIGDGYDSPSIDRIDNSKGYLKNNVHWLLWRVNEMKKDMDLKEFLKLCKDCVNWEGATTIPKGSTLKRVEVHDTLIG